MNSRLENGLVSVDDITRDDVDSIVELAENYATMCYPLNMLNDDVKEDFICGMLFFEPSTRTHCSFQAAVSRLGGRSIVMPGTEMSSISKGETIEDTVHTFSQYCDMLVIRHPEKGIVKKLQEIAAQYNVPVINGGDGDGEHPTQALLDFYTIKEHCERTDGISICFQDSLRSRTVNSLKKILSKYKDNKYYGNLSECVEDELDILYLTRFQKERFKDDAKNATEAKKATDAIADISDMEKPAPLSWIVDILNIAAVRLYNTFTSEKNKIDINDVNTINKMNNARYILNKDTYKNFTDKVGIMHPLPRGPEIHPEVDAGLPGGSGGKILYFKQMRNGVHVRMGLIKLILRARLAKIGRIKL